MIHRLKKLIGHRHPLRMWWHASKAFAAAVWYRFPARKLTVIGITGTDGKTTSIGMLAHVLHQEGLSVGALSTAFFRVKDNITWNHTEKTSPSPFVIQKFLRQLVTANCTHAILEVSSHGLVQHRLDYTWPKYTAMTNIDQEHLDYHGTMEQYIKDKGLLFKKTCSGGAMTLHVNDDSFEEYKHYTNATQVLYSTDKNTQADVILKNITSTQSGSEGVITIDNKDYTCKLPILGIFNQLNATCVLSICKSMNVNIENATTHLQTFTNGPGRMQPVEAGQPYQVFIDFAVTPQAFEATLSTLQSILPNDAKLIVLTGSCGDRMREKRPLIGKICSEYADVFIVTDDEPYTEDPAQIRREVLEGTDESTCIITEIEDREEAIRHCMQQASAGDIVLLAGLGSYPSRMFHDGLHPWDEEATAIKAIKAAL